MKFYAYIPDKNGREPLGTDNRTLFELKTVQGAIRHATKRLKTQEFCLFSYRNFYDNETFRILYDQGALKPHNIYSNW